MSKSIVIHNNNINLEYIPKELEHLSFGLQTYINTNDSDILDNDIDNYMSKFIETIKNEGNFDLIFIKDTLSENYMDLYGLLLAYHIRLDTDKDMKYIPIVIISDLDVYTINLISPYAKILFTKNIYFIKNHPDEIAKMQKKIYKNTLSNKNFKDDFLNLIDIESPASYTSHHSIANEWAIYRWADFLEVKLSTEIQDSIYRMLYFKYLKALHSFEDSKSTMKKHPQKPKKQGDVLLIDDEYKKGWEDIFEKLLGVHDNINFKTLEYEYKDNDCDIICSDITTFIAKNLPDVIILDLRLCDNDFEQKKIENITGIKLIHEIKKINPAIQIILWTASGDSIILDEVNQLNILGYIKKEYLGDRTADVNNSIKSLIDLVDKGLEKKYLKEIWIIQNNILILGISNEMNIEIKSIFEILDSQMENKFIYAMFAIFKVIEMINNYYFIDGYKKAIWRDNPQKEISDNSSKNKILLILDKKLHLQNRTIYQNIDDIIRIRNNTIHPKSAKIDRIDKEHIISWFKMLQTILEKINK
jgi:CheY-like chemotaxis protein